MTWDTPPSGPVGQLHTVSYVNNTRPIVRMPSSIETLLRFIIWKQASDIYE